MLQPVNPAYIVKPVDKALQVLQCLADEGRELTLTEVTYKVGLPKASVFRYLTTLRRWGLVSHDMNTDLYRLGTHLCTLAARVGKSSGLREAALPVMRTLRDEFNETINLGELDGCDVVYLEIVEARRSLRMQAVIASRDPAYATALGKAILCELPSEMRHDHLPNELSARTPQTHTSRAALERNLQISKERGYAVERGENEEGALCIAAAIRIAERPVAAISLSAPVSRITRGNETKIAEAIRQGAAQISARLRQPSLS